MFKILISQNHRINFFELHHQNSDILTTHINLILGSVPEGRKAINPSSNKTRITFDLGGINLRRCVFIQMINLAS